MIKTRSNARIKLNNIIERYKLFVAFVLLLFSNLINNKFGFEHELSHRLRTLLNLSIV